MGSRPGDDAHWLMGDPEARDRSLFKGVSIQVGSWLGVCVYPALWLGGGGTYWLATSLHDIVRNVLFSGLESYCVEPRRM